MFAQTERPSNFSEVVGETENSRILLSIARNPASTPGTLIFSGDFGCGKTSTARLFFKAINCQSIRDGKAHDICGKCLNCVSDIRESRFYNEYDASQLDDIDKVRETFAYGNQGRWRVVVFDEVHLLSKKMQSALLKELEDNKRQNKFIFCTTDPDMLIPTIRSRSLELTYTTKPAPLVADAMMRCAQKHGFDLPKQTANVIAQKSHGHMRDAYMLLDRYVLSGNDAFMKSTCDFQLSMMNFLFAMIGRGVPKETLDGVLSILLRYPSATFREEYQRFFLDVLRGMTFSDDNVLKPVKNFIEKACYFHISIPRLVRFCTQDWVLAGFTDAVGIQTTLLVMYSEWENLRK